MATTISKKPLNGQKIRLKGNFSVDLSVEVSYNRYMVRNEEQAMTYVMKNDLRDYILAQRAEAEEFSKQPGCWMGKMVHPSDVEYWSERAPSGTLREFKRTELIEDAYYMTADHHSKSYARSLDFQSWSDEKLLEHIEYISSMADACREAEEAAKKLEEARLDQLATDMRVDRETLDRWMDEDYPSEIFRPATEQPEYEVY